MANKMVILREATPQDIDTLVGYFQAMLRAMASYGGHALIEDDQLAVKVRAHFAELQMEGRVCLIAVQTEEEQHPVGVVDATIEKPYPVFKPKPVLHIHGVYVEPDHRGEGIGRRLLEAALEWGREKGCVEADLNTLVGNPARELYEQIGFEVFQLKMRLKL
jgi:GNAT superfamily N-acetyltransferase